MVPAGIQYLLHPLLPNVKDRIANLRRALRIAARTIGWWGLTSKYWCGIEDFVADHLSFAIPEDVAQVDAIAHLFKIFIWILSALRRQRCMRSTSIRPKLADGRPTCQNDSEVAFEGTDVVSWNHAPCSAVNHQNIDGGLTRFTGSVLIECLLGDCGRPSNAQRCSDQTKTKENVQLPFGFRLHLHVPQ